MQVVDVNGNMFGYDHLEIIGADGRPKTLDSGLTSVGLSMPSAFTVSNSPLTSNGTIGVTGAGTTSQYIDGTGSLRSFPSLTGYVPYVGATQNVDLGEYGLTAGQLTLDTSPTGTAVVGTTRWNNTIGSSETTLKGGSVILKNGVDLVVRVVNKVTPNTTLTKAGYAAVRVSGAQGQRLAVAYAQANNDANSADTIGLVTETIATNQEGFIITVGNLEDVNTTGSIQGETWADGDVLYLSPTTPGALTNVKPTGLTGHIVVIGYVEYAHAVHGKIYVKIMNGWELDELHNVYINNPLNNQGLFYETATQLWKNKSISTALGYTPVPDSRTLSINGTTYDLTANRSWSVGTVTGVTASFPLSSSGGTTPNITISQASSTDDGYLSAADWTTFNSKQPAGNYITALSGEASGSGPGTASVTLNNASVTAKVLTGVNITGGSINASDSILTAFGKLQNQINGLVGSSIYQGTWNASTNTPALASGVGTRGYYYIVSVAGSTNLDGITDWNVGDWAIFDGTAWQQVDNTDSVTSVNGQTGAVSLTTDNIPEGATNLYFTSLRARQSLSLTTTGTSGAATYNNTTGVLNIPQYQSVLTNPVTGTGTTNYVARWTSSSQIGTGVLYDDGTNVGIGTASPVGKLSVDGGDFRFNYGNAATGYYAWFNHNSSQDGGILLSRDNSTLDWQINNATGGNLWFYAYGLGAVALTMQRSNGFVGIGTTAPGKPLDVFGDVRFQSANSRLDFTTAYNGLNDLPAGILLSTWNTTNNNLGIIPSANGTVGSKVVMGAYNGSVWRSMVEFANTSGEPNLLLVKSAGNVGIGTSAPDYKLDIRSNTAQILSSDSSFTAWYIGNSGVGNAQTYYDAINGDFSGLDYGFVGQNNVGYMEYYVGPFSPAPYHVFSSGNVGIGTTAPIHKLSVVGKIGGSVFGDSYIEFPNTGNTILKANDNVIVGYLQDTIFTQGGNVGIGSLGPNSLLSATERVLLIENSNLASLYLSSLAGRKWSMSSAGDGALVWWDLNAVTERMRINSSGNVGIGTSSPAYKLTVAGRTYVDQLQYNQAIQISGTDLNGWTDAGFYAGSGLGNAPDPYGWYFITVERHSDASWVHQTATSYGAGNTGNRIYSRTKEAGSWTAWKELSYTSNISGTTNYVSKFTSSNTIGNSLIYDNGTNVGIGTTGPSFKFEVIGNVSFDSGKQFTVNNGNGNSYEVYYNGGTGANSWRHIYGANGTGYGVGVGGYGIYYQGNGDYNQINFPNGNTYFGYNVGIGTTSPAHLLNINSSVTNDRLSFSHSGSVKAIFGVTNGGDFYLYNNSSLTFPLWVNNVGNLGIGTTNPYEALDINGNIRLGNYTTAGTRYIGYANNTFANQFIAGMSIESTTVGGNYSQRLNFVTHNYGVNIGVRMTIAENGNVGVGTTNPLAILSVGNGSILDTNVPFQISSEGSGTQKWIGINKNGNYGLIIGYVEHGGLAGNGAYIRQVTTDPIYFTVNSTTTAMSIISNGNVGIGTTTPSQKLHVEGNVRVTGAYYDSNNSAGTSGQVLSSTGSGTDWVDSPTATATSVSQLLPSATVTYNWVGSVVNDTWVDVFTRANNVLTTGVWMVTMFVSDWNQGGAHYSYRYSGTMTWYQDGTNQTGVSAASEIELHRMGHAANDSVLYLRTTEVSAASGGNGKLQIKGNYSNTSNTTITFTFVKIM